MEKENIQEIYNYCYEDKFNKEDVANRRLYLNCEVDSEILDTITYHILRYNRLDSSLPMDERKPIIIYINSPGGSLVDGYGAIDAISTSITPVYTVNLALSASMGLLIYLAGKKRFSMPHAEFLLHDGSSFCFDSTAKAKDRLEFETIQLEQMTKDYILSHSNIKEDVYDERYRKEWYFLPEEGQQMGVVDYIVGKDCEIGEIL